MFKKVKRELRKLEQGVQMPISLSLDDAGYVDRRCPTAECQFEFKVLFEDWRDKVSDDHVYCPFCRRDERATEWNTDAQAEYIRFSAVAFLQGVISQALKEDAHKFNRQQKPGFIQMSMSVKPGNTPLILPVEAAGIMEQRLACEACGCRYG